MSVEDYPQEVRDALKRDLGISIREDKRRRDADTRFCYGATCTWFGSIHETSSTATHPRHANDKFVASPAYQAVGGVPCCPLCGGVLFEMPSESEWWDGMDKFERGEFLSPKAPSPRPHPGYRAMWEWQKAQNLCFRHFNALAAAYKVATGITVDTEP